MKRLADYECSSYRMYAYAEPGPEWLETGLILSQISGDNKSIAYRRKVQTYSGEEKKVIEDVHMGLLAGTKKFARFIKNKHMPKEPNEEIPQQKSRKDDFEIEHLLKKTSSILECDIKVFKNSRRISQTEKIKRDIMIYLLWKTGSFTNKEIASHFGIGYSAVSRRVSCCNNMIESNKDFKEGYKLVKSLIKS